MAAHVVADPHLGLGRRRQMKMRIKTGHAVNLVERRLRALGKGFEVRLWQIPVAQLDGPQFVEDHGERSREMRRYTFRAGAFPEMLHRILGGSGSVVNRGFSQ